jgi:CubicO group peptidase (beta-lactamase class C family)
MTHSRFRSPLAVSLSLLILLGANGPPVRAQTEPAAVIDVNLSPRFHAVADAVEQAMEHSETPGVSIGVLADGREETASFGVTSVETNQPVTSDTRFQIGSITKTFTATALMRLVEQGEWTSMLQSERTCPSLASPTRKCRPT